MWICPVCDHKNTKKDCCSACGFDRSCSYEEFNKNGKPVDSSEKNGIPDSEASGCLCVQQVRRHLFFTPGKGQEADLRELRS